MQCCILDPSSNSWALPYLRLPSLYLFLLHIGSSAYLCICSHVPFSSREPLPCGFFCIENLSFQPWLSAAPLWPWCDTFQTVLTCWTESVHPGKTEAALLLPCTCHSMWSVRKQASGQCLSPGLMFSHFNKKGIWFSDVLWPDQSWYHKMGWEVVVNSHWKVHLQEKISWATHVYKEYRLLRISVFVHLGLGGMESGSPGHIPSEL